MKSDYRKQVQEVYDSIERAFESTDPDLAECEQALGALTITLANGAKCILSSQPSVEQIWLALASQGTAYHFRFDAQKEQWLDDKGRGLELKSLLRKYLKEATGGDFQIQ